MNTEKGKPAFPDDVNAILSEKIKAHTKKNADAGDREADDTPSAFQPPQQKACCGTIHRNKCIALCLVFASIIAGIVSFFLFKPKFPGIKKRKFPGFFD